MDCISLDDGSPIKRTKTNLSPMKPRSSIGTFNESSPTKRVKLDKKLDTNQEKMEIC